MTNPVRCPECWGEPIFCDDCYSKLDREEEDTIEELIITILSGVFPPPDPSMDLHKIAERLRTASKVLLKMGSLTPRRIDSIKTWLAQAGISIVREP